MSIPIADRILVAIKATEWRRWRTNRKGNPKCGGPTFFTVWRTHMWRGTTWFTVWRTCKWWKCKLQIALKAMVLWKLTENKSFKYTPIFYSAQLRRCSNIIPLYPGNQLTCKQRILLEHKIERHSTTARLNYYKNCVLSPPLMFERWINKLSYFRLT